MHIDLFVADGLYATEYVIASLIKIGLHFEMRFHANRIVEYGGKQIAIRAIDDWKISCRNKQRVKKGSWKGIALYFSAVRRQTKAGSVTIVYQVSNYFASAATHAHNYGLRWAIEKFFRTAKQHLGLNDCQARSIGAQQNHIFNVFFAYALTQVERAKHCLKNPEAAIKRLKRKKYHFLISRFSRSNQLLGQFMRNYCNPLYS